MSKMSDLAYDIEQLYIEGLHPTKIAKELGCPLGVVYDWLEDQSLAEDAWEEFLDEIPNELNKALAEPYSPYITSNS